MLSNFRTKYRVQCKIGEGSFSEVLKCVDRHSGICIAAKQLKRSFRSAAQAEEMPELIAMRKLTRHPNILHMIESHFDKDTGKVTLVFELMDMSLYDLIRSRKKCIPETKAKHYLYQIVKGIDHIHHHGIFHRDIKPENILIKGDVIKISDLGSIKGIYTKQPYTEYISTRWYRSPECLLTTGFYGPKMDVWAIGCVFFELLTLKPLFPGSSEVDQISKIHSVLGTPNPRLLSKFKRHKPRNCNVNFPPKQGTGLNPLIPFISDIGREVLKQMIVYDPETRINIRRLVEHKYFDDLRDHSSGFNANFSWTTIGSGSLNKTSWRNPALLSFLTNEKRKKPKVTKVMPIQKKISKEVVNMKEPLSKDPPRINLATGPGDWKSSNSSLMKLKERLCSKNYQIPTAGLGGVGEVQNNPNKLRDMKSLDLRAGIENSNRYLNMKLPPLLHEGPVKKDLQLPRVPSRKSVFRGNTLEDFRSGFKK